MTELTVAQIAMNDILLGRGKRIHAWEGNMRFRQIVAERCVPYHLSNDAKLRNGIAREVFDLIKNQHQGRFLRPWTRAPDNATTTERLLSTTWVEVCCEDALRKIKQALRDTGAKAVASGKSIPVQKKNHRKLEGSPKKTPLEHNPMPFAVMGATVSPRCLHTQDKVVSWPTQQFAITNTNTLPSEALAVNSESKAPAAQFLSASDSIQYPVTLRRSYTLDSANLHLERSSRYRQNHFTELGGRIVFMADQYPILEDRANSAAGFMPRSAVIGNGGVPTTQGSQLWYSGVAQARLPAISRAGSSIQRLKQEQPNNGTPSLEILSLSEIQMIDEALSVHGEQESHFLELSQSTGAKDLQASHKFADEIIIKEQSPRTTEDTVAATTWRAS